MKRQFDLLTHINKPAFFPAEIDFLDLWGDSPHVGETIELKGLLPKMDEEAALNYLYENGKVARVKEIASSVENGVHLRVFRLELI